MLDGKPEGGNSAEPLTASDAVTQLAGLFSDESEDTQPREPQPKAKKTPKAPVVEDTDDADEGDTGLEATADDDEESADVEGDESPDAEEQTEGDEEQPTPQTFKVRVDGKDVEVTLDELTKGYSRQQDYTRKTQDLSTTRKSWQDTEVKAVREERAQYAERLGLLHDAIERATQEPDWNTLAAQDPELYAEYRPQWDAHQKRLQAIKAEQQKAFEQIESDRAEQLREFALAERDKLVAALPEWSDAETARKAKGELQEYAKTLGYSPEDLKSVYDHRLLLMLNKAMLYDRAQSNKAKLRKQVAQKIEQVKSVTPGSPTAQKRKVTERTRSLQRLAQTGRVNDGADAIGLLDLD